MTHTVPVPQISIDPTPQPTQSTVGPRPSTSPTPGEAGGGRGAAFFIVGAVLFAALIFFFLRLRGRVSRPEDQ